MREELVTPVTARRLATAGLLWEPQIGDWVTVLGAEHISEAQVGLWLVAALSQTLGQLGLVDALGQWPMAQVPPRDCLWLPTAGKLKTWLRAQGYRVATGEATAPQFGLGALAPRHVCRLTRQGEAQPIDGEGSNEPEAVADALLRILGEGAADAPWR